MAWEGRFDGLLAAARAGADWAWVEIYDELSPRVLGYLRARGAREPEDLTAEVFLQIVRDLAGFQGGERAFRSWVFVIAHNRLLDERRKAARRPLQPVPDRVLESHSLLDEDDGTDVLASQPIGRLLSRLSPDQQAVLLLRILGDLTVDEVARVVGKRPGAVKALQRRALNAVRTLLAQEGVTL
jgi:RNA polymerase sigma factor (sigma-70 family)